ncbi:MAG: glycosyltransferase [Capsulimonadales bacterium]|nr:glycosyltransferase [Capsulimonadales bacterium]
MSFRMAFLFAHLHKGGMQKAVSTLSCALPDDIRQHLLYFGTENPGFAYRAEEKNLGATIPRGRNPVGKARAALARVRRLQAFIDAEKPDVIVSFGEAANILNLLTRRKRTVLSVRVSLPESLAGMAPYGSVYGVLVRRLYPRADRIVAVSEGIADQLTDGFGVPRRLVTVIRNGYDAERIRALAKEPLPDDRTAQFFSAPTVTNVASLAPQKGQEHLIRAFARARREIPDLRLCLVGRGEKQAEFERLAESLGVRDSVLFAGFDPNPYRYLSRSRVFVLPSRFEGFPNALVEAMICGLPVIATDCPTGPREILGASEHGILAEAVTDEHGAQAEAQIAEGIVRLITTGDGRLFAERARRRSAEFRLETAVARWLEVIGYAPERS